MSSILTTYEVEVAVPNGPDRYVAQLGGYVPVTQVRMFHKKVRTPRQAMEWAKKFGRPISARKFDVARPLMDIEHITPSIIDVIPPALAIDEFVWAKQIKKRENLWKDKEEK